MSEEPAKRVVGRPFQPGEGGRPKGARNKLGEAFLEAMAADFAKGGIDAIEATRIADPPSYCRIIAGLLPKEVTGADGEPLLTGITVTFVRPHDGDK